MLISTLGLSLMASAADLIMLYLAMETATLPLFILAGFMNLEKKAVEAGLKYLLFGAVTSGVMLYGFSLLYGFSGQTQIAGLGAALAGAGNLPFVIGILLVVVGFGFKIAAVPFHFWSPDVYEGAPAIVAGFLSTASKAAGFIVLLRFVGAFLPVQIGHLDDDRDGPGGAVDDRRQSAGPGAEELQTHAGVFLDRPGRLRPGGRGRRLAGGCLGRGLLPGGVFVRQHCRLCNRIPCFPLL